MYINCSQFIFPLPSSTPSTPTPLFSLTSTLKAHAQSRITKVSDLLTKKCAAGPVSFHSLSAPLIKRNEKAWPLSIEWRLLGCSVSIFGVNHTGKRKGGGGERRFFFFLKQKSVSEWWLLECCDPLFHIFDPQIFWQGVIVILTQNF